MFSFRQKIFLSSALVFFIFIILLFPFISRWVHHIVIQSMEDRVTEIIQNIKDAPNNEALIRRLKDQKSLVGDFTKKIITHWELFEFSKEELKTIKELCQKPFSIYLLPRQKEGYKILSAQASKHLGSIKD